MCKIIEFFKRYFIRIKKILKYSFLSSTSVLTFCLIFISDDLILNIEEKVIKVDWMLKIGKEYKPLFYKSIFFIFVFLVTSIIFILYYLLRKRIIIKDKNYTVEIKYGDLFDIKNCIPVVNSDECFTSKIGNAQGDIKKSSVYGQYLSKHRELNILNLIKSNGIKPERGRSKYKNQVCYKPGTILCNDDALILAFARLDEDGCAMFESLDDYMSTLSFMWKEIKSKHGDTNVAIPLLGSGRTTINGVKLSRQEILDYFILSYKMSQYKLQRDYKLIICCYKSEIVFDNISVI